MGEKLIDRIFNREQAKWVKRAVVNTSELSENLNISTLKIGKETILLVYGVDANDNTQHVMLSRETFKKLKNFEIKGED